MNRRIAELERASVEVMLEYLREETPSEETIKKATFGLGAFTNVQRHRSAENARWGLELLAERLGNAGPRQIASESSPGTTSSSRSESAG